MNVIFKKLNPNAVIPQKATSLSIGYDLYVLEDICIKQQRQVIPLGFALELPEGIEAKIEPRSGFSSKGIEGFAVLEATPESKFNNGLWRRIDAPERFDADVLVGKIDPDYRGEVGVIIRNNQIKKPFIITKGTRIAQMSFYKTCDAVFDEVAELSETSRGDGGFGSTGN